MLYAGLDLSRKPLDYGDTLTPEFERKNPHRSTPVLELPDGRTLYESNAILWYLAAGRDSSPQLHTSKPMSATGSSASKRTSCR
jgi:glutathione S-transferase